MNFFERQDQARSKTSRLVLLFITALLCIFLAIHTVVAGVMYVTDKDALFMATWLDPGLLLLDFCAVSLLIGGASLLKSLQLSSLKGSGVAELYGGTRVERNTSVLQERQLLNVVEEMAIASGVHVPDVYILRDEPSINAFAAGATPETSAIAVTQGSLDYLTRDELQGVIGHEFSHILNHDTRIDMRFIGILFGLQMIMFLGIFLFRNSIYLTNSRSSDSRDNGAALGLVIMLAGAALSIIGFIGVIFSNIIQAAVSRQREFLADASSVQFTRNPSGLAGAFKKIGCPNVGSTINNTSSIEACHLFFGSIFSPGFLSALYNTHPPLEQRIRQLDPSFDGTFPEMIERINWADRYSTVSATGDASQGDKVAQVITTAALLTAGAAGDSVSVSSATLPLQEKPSQEKKTPTIKVEQQIKSIGELTDAKLKCASSLIAALPASLEKAARTVRGAKCLVLALLIDRDWEQRKKQLAWLIGKLSPEEGPLVRQDLTAIDEIPVAAKVPLLELAWPSLKELERTEYIAFRDYVNELVRSDGRVDLFEFTLQQYLLGGLDRHFGLARHPQSRYRAISSVLDPYTIVLSYLAYAGSDDADGSESARHAFNTGAAALYIRPDMKPKEECTPAAFGQALMLLTQTSPTLKEHILRSFYLCVADDGVVTEEEGELMRAITAALGCPMPSWSGTPA